MKRNQHYYKSTHPEYKALNPAEALISHFHFTARRALGTLFLRIGGIALRYSEFFEITKL